MNHHAPGPSSALVAKLANFAALSAAEVEVLHDLGRNELRFAPDTDIIAEGETPHSIYLIREGFACRYRVLPDGGRQILSFLIPGDICSLSFLLGTPIDHSIGTLTPTRVGCVSSEALMALLQHQRRIAAAMWWSTLQEEAMLRERIVALGRRNAHGRIAYLLCELMWREQAVGLTHQKTVSLPFTQTEIGDALGLTPVHVSRVLKQFRDEGIIELAHRQLTIRDVGRLQHIAGLNSDYLQFGPNRDLSPSPRHAARR